jgi:hypothetical protein
MIGRGLFSFAMISLAGRPQRYSGRSQAEPVGPRSVLPGTRRALRGSVLRGCLRIYEFESAFPSQPPLSLPGELLHTAKSRHFRRLAATSLVSGEEFRASRTESLESTRRVSAGQVIRNLRADRPEGPVAFPQRPVRTLRVSLAGAAVIGGHTITVPSLELSPRARATSPCRQPAASAARACPRRR